MASPVMAILSKRPIILAITGRGQPAQAHRRHRDDLAVSSVSLIAGGDLTDPTTPHVSFLHLRVSRYLFDGPTGTNIGAFDPTFNGGQPLVINENVDPYLFERSDSVGGVTVDALGNIVVAGSTRAIRN